MVTRVTGTTEITCLSQMTLAEGGMGDRSAMTSDENLLSWKESAKKAGVHWYACVLQSWTPLAWWNTSSGTEAAPLEAATLRLESVLLHYSYIQINTFSRSKIWSKHYKWLYIPSNKSSITCEKGAFPATWLAFYKPTRATCYTG